MCGAWLCGCQSLFGVDFADPAVDAADAMAPHAPKVVNVSTSAFGTFALLDNGSIWSWGLNTQASLGLGYASDAPAPPTRAVAFEGLGTIRMVAPGKGHTCVLNQAGQVYCLGTNQHGTLGTGSLVPAQSATPVRVVFSRPAVSLVSGDDHSCVTLNDRRAYCWGSNAKGQLGGSDVGSDRPTPAVVEGIPAPGFLPTIASGPAQTCGIDVVGALYCMGANDNGQVLLPSSESVSTPARKTELSDMRVLAPGTQFGCALLDEGTAKCWGANDVGQLGIGETGGLHAPKSVLGLADARDLVAGAAHACALMQDGSVFCWGYNAFGQLGIGGTSDSNVRQRVQGLPPVVGLTANRSHSCAWAADGAVFCWGSNTGGPLGNGTTQDAKTPTRVIQGW